MTLLRRVVILTLLSFLANTFLMAAADRIAAPIDAGRRVVVKGHLHPQARSQNDRGPVAGSLELNPVTLLLRPAAGLDQFLSDVQAPSSANYHRWLSPEQFADRFGLSANDIAKVVSWLEGQGLRVNQVARGRHWITFHGSADQVARALQTSIHRFDIDGATHYANATDPSVPEALEGVVAGFTGLNDILPAPTILRPKAQSGIGADYNRGTAHYLAPGDFATMFNITPLYQAGIDGTGQKIAVAGQTDINLSDIRAFRKQFNLPALDPQIVHYGPAPGITGDLIEADLDLEWSGATAPNASLIYVVARNAFDAVQYAIDQNLAPVITASYGSCEQSITPGWQYIAQQASAQGITIMVSSGDAGATACDFTSFTPQASKGNTVGFPANLPEVTSIGGTRLNEGTGTYWDTANGVNLASALSYIPEVAWNDSVERNDLSSTGGGASLWFPKPSWQTGPGVPDDGARDVPDVSFPASPDHDPYWVTSGGVSGGVGGTSAGSPAFAGIVALLNQYLVAKGSLAQPGLGNINPMLYRLAQTTTNIFHDVTAGDNKMPCAQSSPGCVDGLVGHSTGPGYDMVTGLGSIDVDSLARQWTITPNSTITLTANPAQAAIGDTVELTATVTAGLFATPTGSVTFLANDALLGTVPLKPAANGSVATLTYPAMTLAAGTGIVTAAYSGEARYAPSSATATVTLKLPAAGSLVVPLVTPTTVRQVSPGYSPFKIVLTEKAGVATKLTGLQVSGVDYTSQIVSFFGTANIPAKGTLTASLVSNPLTVPQDVTFVFSGVDEDGAKWTQQATTTFVGPAAPFSPPSFKLTVNATNAAQNPSADSSCQWAQGLTIDESGGYLFVLTKLTAGATDLTSQIQSLFGTTRLAPFGALRGTLCWSGPTPPAAKTLQLTGVSEDSSTVTRSVAISFAGPPQDSPAFTVSPSSVSIPAGNESAIPALSLQFGSGSPKWTAVVSPGNGTASWLTLSPASGSGSGKVSLSISTKGLSNGAYRAMVTIEAPDSVPQYVNVPVYLVVGAGPNAAITGIANNFSGAKAFAPGMMLAVYGAQLAPPGTSTLARGLPLPLTTAGVSATVNGISAPLYFVSPGQLDVQIPYESGAGPALLAVNNNGEIAMYPFEIAVAAPGIAAAADGRLFPANAQQGQAYVLYVTGEGEITPIVATGTSAPSGTATSRLPKPRLPVTVTVGGVTASVSFVGIPAGLAGVTQINFTVPRTVAPGAQPVVVTVGGVASPPATLNVTPAPGQ